jgi:enterochelin esterase-like enzyme
VQVTFTYEDRDAMSLTLQGAIAKLADTPEFERDGAVWRLELDDVPTDLRTVYWFARDGETDWTKWLTDPANPKTYVYPAGLEFAGDSEVRASLFEGPEVPPYEWSVDRDVPRGDVRVEVVGGRRVWVYTPRRRAEGLLLLFDGHAYTTLAPAPLVLDNLIAAGRIPPLAAVLPDSLDTASRMRDLAANDEFLAFCVDELLPLAGVTAPPELTVAAGSSMGGLAAAHAALRRPDVFGNALVQSGAWMLAPGLLAGRRVPVRFYLDVGVLEDWPDFIRGVRDLLREQGYEVAYHEFPGGHDFFWWRETLAWGLLALLGE